jgi:hypothetical protein
MADIEDPDGGDRAIMEAAEPNECSRCMFIFMVGCLTLALFAFALFADDFHGSHPDSAVLCIAKIVLEILASFVASGFVMLFALLLCEWYDGNTEGNRLVDRLIQSDGYFQELVQFLCPHRVEN